MGFTEWQIFSKVVESVERWGSFQSDSTGLYWIIMASVGVGWWKVCFSFVIRFSSWLLGSSKLLSLVFMCTVASRCSQVAVRWCEVYLRFELMGE